MVFTRFLVGWFSATASKYVDADAVDRKSYGKEMGRVRSRAWLVLFFLARR